MFKVQWVKRAEDELTAIWLAARDRYAVTEAASRLDAILRADPQDVGESRDGDKRIAFSDPLAVIFRVLPGNFVEVTHVWRPR